MDDVEGDLSIDELEHDYVGGAPKQRGFSALRTPIVSWSANERNIGHTARSTDLVFFTGFASTARRVRLSGTIRKNSSPSSRGWVFK